MKPEIPAWVPSMGPLNRILMYGLTIAEVNREIAAGRRVPLIPERPKEVKQ